MPLRAVLDDRDVQAFDYDADAWSALKKTYGGRQLLTACCGQKAIPKTSPLGTQFFAHARRGECTTAPETKEHILAKTIIAKTARAAGWEVITEAPGATPDGAPWIADVLCERGGRRIALETQWSPQVLEAYRERQERYRLSGVRAAWFVRRLPRDPTRWGEAKSDSTLPLFQLQPDEDARGFTIKPFGVTLAEFVTGMLSGDLHWGPAPGTEYAIHAVITSDTCWRCGRETGIIAGLEAHHPRCGPVGFAHAANEPAAYQFLREHLPQSQYQELRLGILKHRHSRTAGGAYLSQGCHHCDALMGDYFVMERTMEQASAGALPPGVPVTTQSLTPELARLFHPSWHLAGRQPQPA